MRTVMMLAAPIFLLALGVAAEADMGRKLLQTVLAGTPSTLTVSAANPTVNAITITLAIPYPQNAYFCNVTGDPRIPQQGPFPLTVRTPVGVTATVVFANITGPIPGSNCQMGTLPQSVVQQQGTASSVIQQMVNNPSSVVQQSGSASVVQQGMANSINQQNPDASQFLTCSGSSSTIIQQQGSSSSVVQQSSSPSTIIQQPSTPTTVVQQPSPPTTVVQQPSPPVSSVVQQPSTPKSTPATSVVQQPSTPKATAVTVLQQPSTPGTVTQQSTIAQQGRKLLQVGTIEYISNNGSTGAQLSVLDTTEGVPNISFKPTAAGQTAQFNGALQVAVTTTNDGFGTPYIPYRVDSRLSPQCNVQVNFVGF